MVAMRSAKAAIAHSMKTRDLINSNSADHSLGDKAPVGASRHLCRRGSLSFKQRGRGAERRIHQRQAAKDAVGRCVQEGAGASAQTKPTPLSFLRRAVTRSSDRMLLKLLSQRCIALH